MFNLIKALSLLVLLSGCATAQNDKLVDLERRSADASMAYNVEMNRSIESYDRANPLPADNRTAAEEEDNYQSSHKDMQRLSGRLDKDILKAKQQKEMDKKITSVLGKTGFKTQKELKEKLGEFIRSKEISV